MLYRWPALVCERYSAIAVLHAIVSLLVEPDVHSCVNAEAAGLYQHNRQARPIIPIQTLPTPPAAAAAALQRPLPPSYVCA